MSSDHVSKTDPNLRVQPSQRLDSLLATLGGLLTEIGLIADDPGIDRRAACAEIARHIRAAIAGATIEKTRLPARAEEQVRRIQALVAAAPDLLILAHQYAAECTECDGLGTDMNEPEQPCPQCADIRHVIAKAEGRS